MGFQTADVRPFAKSLLATPGVTGVWVVPAPDDRGCLMLIAVAGLDDKGYANRMNIRDRVEEYLDQRREEMGMSGFVFDYRLTVDEPELGPLHVPASAVAITAA